MALRRIIGSALAAVLVAAAVGVGVSYFMRHQPTAAMPSPASDETAGEPSANAEAPVETPAPSPQTTTAAPPADSEVRADVESDDIDAAIAEQARPAHSTVEIDTNMALGKSYEATLIIERGTTGTVKITEATPQPTAAEVPVTITSEAMAQASSAELDITPTSPDWQALTGNKPTVWSWNVKPRDEGTAHVTFTLYQKVNIGGEKRTVAVERYPRTIAVTVTPMSTAQRFLRGIYDRLSEPVEFAASIAGLLTFFAGILSGRRRGKIGSGMRAR